MAPKKKDEGPVKGPWMLGKFSTHLKVGLVGAPNVGKSTLYNSLSKSHHSEAANYPFCTINPSETRVHVEDERFDWLVDFVKPKSVVKPFLTIVDIAGLIKGASTGEGLGNAFLSHINAVDGIIHVMRAFEDETVIHHDDKPNPVADIEMITSELRIKDIAMLRLMYEAHCRMKQGAATSNPQALKNWETERDAILKFIEYLESGKDIRLGMDQWSTKDIEYLNEYSLLTAKPVMFAVNLNLNDFKRKKNKFLKPIFDWVQANAPGSLIIPYAGSYEEELQDLDAKACKEREESEEGAPSALPKMIRNAFSMINLVYFFTYGVQEVRAWVIRRGMKAPEAGGVIHTDFTKAFIMAEVMAFHELKEAGSEAAMKEKGRWRQEGKNYEVLDGDCIQFKIGQLMEHQTAHRSGDGRRMFSRALGPIGTHSLSSMLPAVFPVSHCSALESDDLLRFAGCGTVPAAMRTGSCMEDQCGPCDEDQSLDPAAFASEHPLLQEQRGGSEPRSPRGPMPPWAVTVRSRTIDRTATGATPPRSLTPPRSTPPGLPDEEVKNAATILSLVSSFGASFMKDLFAAVRRGDLGAVNSLINRVTATAYTLACGGSEAELPEIGSAVSAEKNEKSAELVAGFLSKARDASSQQKDTLLGVAALGGHVQIVQLLLTSRAEPLAADDKGNNALHKAAEGGNVLTTLVVLDRMQSNDRSISVSELANSDGETPEMAAALVGACDICRAFEVFSDMQHDAEMKQLGSNLPAPDLSGGHRVDGTGDILACIDINAMAASATAVASASLLRRSSVGTRLVQNLFQRIPEGEKELQAQIDRVCTGLSAAEDYLRRTTWNPSDPGLDPALRSFVATAELRSNWQKIRDEAVKNDPSEGFDPGLEDFWQTHLTASSMVSTIRQAMGDTFQHSMPQVPQQCQMVTFQIVAPLVEALAPCDAKRCRCRREFGGYRPLSLPMLGLQKLVDRYLALRQQTDSSKEDESLANSGDLTLGAWISLGAGSFFSSLSSRAMAIRRLSRTRCNALLIIRPDERSPSFPKHMSLRGSSVDDTLFPLETVFRIARITRTVSSDLDAEGAAFGRAGSSRWPVMIIEVYASNRYLQSMEVLQKQGDLGPGELASKLEEWTKAAPTGQDYDRLLEAGELLGKTAAASTVAPPKAGPAKQAAKATALLSPFAAKAARMLSDSATSAEAACRPEVAARALLAKARYCRTAGQESDCRKAIALLEKSLGEGHPEVSRAKSAARDMGVHV
ncbi:unnamed protein product [Polarella glacialis]|uniref:OBG-type G domain-containing protein n=1 Tax=Polarella glacialis TaxID=89957 RepID=A0A813KC50_POLGL|nr:unnamed protein product [Polarella glacialis]